MRTLSPGERLVVNMVVQAINDGALPDPDKPKTDSKRAWKDYYLSIERVPQLRDEARSFVREVCKDHGWPLRAIERYWKNPHCKCGQRVYWPHSKCAKCRAKEATNELADVV